jgi:threonine dehydrogenase-like Zn-dependent dehydrogenase
MKAVRIEEIGRMGLIETEMPEVFPHHVLLKVNSISICGTDILSPFTGMLNPRKAEGIL